MTQAVLIVGLISNLCALLALTVKVAAVVHNIRKDLEILRKDLEIARRESEHQSEMGTGVDHQFKESLDHLRTSIGTRFDSEKVEIRASLRSLEITVSENRRDLDSLERFIDKSFENYSPRQR